MTSMTKCKMQYPATTFIAVVAVLMWVLTCGGSMATALDIDFDFHDDSAHGNRLEGVDRLGAGHDTGDCAHCHDTFDDSICGVNPAMLFKPRNPTNIGSNFCLKCHRGSATVQVGGITNNDYGATFGGGTAMFGHIRGAFNVSSTYSSIHNLAKVRNYARDNADWGSWVTDNTNACVICHDQHLSQKNFPVEINANGGVNTALRRGNDYPGDLWGDEPAAAPDYSPEMMSDLMSDWGTTYQAPYRADLGREPGPEGSTIEDGSNLPNYVWACAETCHRLSTKGREPVNWQTTASSEWPGTPSAHGRLSANGGGFGVLKPPYGNGYDSDNRGSFVLSCTDCHEPHASKNSALLRRTVNSVSGLEAYPGSSSDCRWTYFCEACHEIYPQDPGDPSQQHPVIWPGARCGDYVGCHMRSDGSGGNHGYMF